MYIATIKYQILIQNGENDEDIVLSCTRVQRVHNISNSNIL